MGALSNGKLIWAWRPEGLRCRVIRPIQRLSKVMGFVVF